MFAKSNNWLLVHVTFDYALSVKALFADIDEGKDTLQPIEIVSMAIQKILSDPLVLIHWQIIISFSHNSGHVKVAKKSPDNTSNQHLPIPLVANACVHYIVINLHLIY